MTMKSSLTMALATFLGLLAVACGGSMDHADDATAGLALSTEPANARTWSCVETVSCSDACQDVECVTRCYAQAAPGSEALARAFEACVDANASTPDRLREKCEKPIAACSADPGGSR
jgi:hypothetical protein